MVVTYLLCRRCRLLHPLWRDDVAPNGDQTAVQLELDLFRAEHGSHELEVARRQPQASIGDGPPWDSMVTRWFRVATAEEELLVRAWRPTVDTPRRFEVEMAAAPDSRARVEIDTALLRRGLGQHFLPGVLRSDKVEAFVAFVNALIGKLDPEALETSFDDAKCANAGVAPFPVQLGATLLVRCAALFDAGELNRLAEFIALNRGEDGCLALRVHWQLASRGVATSRVAADPAERRGSAVSTRKPRSR